MENKNISQIVLERIKEEGIKPISRNVFSVKRVVFWVIVASSFIVGALSFSLTLFALLNNDWDLYNKFGLSLVIETLPYFWLIALAVFTLLGEFYYRKTLLGHRHRFVMIIGIYLISTSVFGSIFYFVGLGEYIEKSLNEAPPIYRNIILNRHGVWSHPEKGLLSGKIILIDNQIIHVIDPKGFIWIVDKNNSLIRGRASIQMGERVKIMGDKIDNNYFKAWEIRPWMGMNMKRNEGFPRPNLDLR